MAIEIYLKSNVGLIEHFGYIQYEEFIILRKASEKLNLACLQFLPYGGDILFNSEQAAHILKEISLLYICTELTPKSFAVLDIINTAAIAASKKSHTFLIFEGD